MFALPQSEGRDLRKRVAAEVAYISRALLLQVSVVLSITFRPHHELDAIVVGLHTFAPASTFVDDFAIVQD